MIKHHHKKIKPVFKRRGNYASLLYLKLTKIQNYTCSALKDDYLHPMASKARAERILSTDQLHNIEQLYNTIQQLF